MATKSKSKWGDREARRRDILAAARALLERGGYERLSIRAVADRAGVSPGTVYTYFAGRESLWATLTGLADHFTGERHRLYAYSWDEMADFAARVLVAGMTPRSIPT